MSFSNQFHQLSAEPFSNEQRGKRDIKAPPRGRSEAIPTDLRLPGIHRLCCSGCSGMKFPLLSFYHSFRSKYHICIITFRCETEKSQCLNFPVLWPYQETWAPVGFGLLLDLERIHMAGSPRPSPLFSIPSSVR